MTTKRIVVISAGLSTPSSTRQLADRLTADAASILRERGVEVEAQVFELRDLAHDITNHLLHGLRPAEAAGGTRRGVDGRWPDRGHADLLDELCGPVQVLHRRRRPAGAHRPSGAHRCDGWNPSSLARDRLRDPAAVHLPARDPGHDRRVRRDERLGHGGDGVRSLPDRIFRGAKEFAELVERTDRSDLINDPFALDRPMGHLVGGSHGAVSLR